ncbi:hypothetical protein FRC03_007849 [Tulasnella sp. 419]|nr:hypothetical protein FRC03_007849 [Tulasnella sp. 419]
MDVEGNPTWPCPKLRYLSLGGPIHIQPIVNIVAARFSKPEAKGLKALEIGYLGEMDPTQTEPEVVDQLLELLNTKNGLLYTTKMDDVESPIYKMLELPNESALELSPSD